MQWTLFDDEGREEHRQLDAVADAVKQEFGASALSRGSGLFYDARLRPDPRPDERSS